MRPKIVYVLGAGFSAPMGLPVVANFIERSRDLFAEDAKRFAHFESVFSLIKDLSAAKSYYSIDLRNIEEVLSLLEMGAFTHYHDSREQFVRYLADVIQACTPAPKTGATAPPGDWRREFLSTDEPWAEYCHFVANLCGLVFSQRPDGTIGHDLLATPVATYSVVSLNYDLVLETALSIIRTMTGDSPAVGFRLITTGVRGDSSFPTLAKIHGSIDDGTIVPPTWNKGGRADVSPAWKAALEALRSANYIRFLGYSLPETDAYVRYLLKYSAVAAPHLKGIDVICRDDKSGTVYNRYKAFIEAPLRYAPRDLMIYLQRLMISSRQFDAPSSPVLPRLEEVHERFMTEPGSA